MKFHSRNYIIFSKAHRWKCVEQDMSKFVRDPLVNWLELDDSFQLPKNAEQGDDVEVRLDEKLVLD